jgi:hypothetical protein
VTLSRFVRLALRLVATGNPPENIEPGTTGLLSERKGRAVVATPPERFGNAAIARKSFALAQRTAIPVDPSSKSYGSHGNSCATRRSQERANVQDGPNRRLLPLAGQRSRDGWSRHSAHRRHLLLLHFRPCVLELGFVPGLTDARENVLLLFPNMAFEARVHCLELGEPRRVFWVELL